MSRVYGYHNNIVRVDLSSRRVSSEQLGAGEFQRWVGGSGLGVRYLHHEVQPGAAWDSEDNKLIIAAGPLSGTGYAGGGGFSGVGIGPMTGFAGCSQANGYFGAYLRRSGIDALVIQGISDEWVYLLANEGGIEIQDARGLVGLDTFQTEEALLRELALKPSQASVQCIGVAGENQVSFACLVGDRGHVASKNGLGAVLGRKKVKALLAINGKSRVPLHDPEAFKEARQVAADASVISRGGLIHKNGTGILIHIAHDTGVLPIKNYQTNLLHEHTLLDAQITRQENQWKRETCFACRVAHCAQVTIAKGPYAGLVAPEPEYEAIAAFGSQLMITDYGSVVHLATLADRLGMDANELGWVLGFVLEACQEGKLSSQDLDGLQPRWGDPQAIEALLHSIARKQGFGALLSKGVRRAAEELGDWATSMAVYTQDGTTPRGHDHRGRWSELLDTCLSASSTIESTFGGPQPEILELAPVEDPFDPLEVARANAAVAGWRLFDDSLVLCRFTGDNPAHILAGFNAATGWDWQVGDAVQAGRRIANALRLIKMNSGVKAGDERPSIRYGSVPQNGPAQGRDIGPHFPNMRQAYFEAMGWDPQTGQPLPETLAGLELD